MHVKHLAKAVLRKCGLDVRLVRNVEALGRRTWQEKQADMWRPFLGHRRIRTVIDVGANVGHFGELAHRLFPDAAIYCFEPLPDCFRELQTTLKCVPRVKLFPFALGDTTGPLRMNRSAFTPCSSVLSGTELLGEDFPDAAVVDEVEVQVVRLDDVMSSEGLEPDVLVKLDVQGYEIPVISGARNTLAQTAIVAVEVCFFRRLYRGQPLFDETYRALSGMGFSYRGNAGQMAIKSDGRVVEADAIFERDGPVAE